MAEMYEIIDRLLGERGISGAQMSSDLGMSRSFMTELRKGRAKSIKVETAQRIAEYFGVSTDYLLGNDEDTRVLEIARYKLGQFVDANPDVSSGERLNLLFDAADYDPVIICHNLDVDQCYINSWIEDNDLPPNPIVDKILGVFRLRPEELFSHCELAVYREQASELPATEKAPAILDRRLPEKPNQNIIRIAGRDGSYRERTVTDEQLALFAAMFDQLPDVPDDL